MPSINVNIGPSGAVANVFVGVSTPRLKALHAAGIAAPNQVIGKFLIDSGASMTVIDPALIASLGITPTGNVPIHTPSTNGVMHNCNQYDVSLFIPGADQSVGCFIDTLPVIETSLSPQGIDGLIGQDLLNRWVSIYQGDTKIFTFSY